MGPVDFAHGPLANKLKDHPPVVQYCPDLQSAAQMVVHGILSPTRKLICFEEIPLTRSPKRLFDVESRNTGAQNLSPLREHNCVLRGVNVLSPLDLYQYRL